MTSHLHRGPGLRRRARGGFALILVLGFVVLLTIVILAFFSNAVLQRQVSDSSANQTRADLFATGALDSIVGDLKQEIVDGSTTKQIKTGSVTTVLYQPSQDSTMVPYREGTDPSWPNLVKSSMSGVGFYPGGGNGYLQAGPTRASTVSTTTPSLNGRSYSAARWNEALLLPPTSATDFTPHGTVAFTPPDWILVAQDGSNPTPAGWDPSLAAGPAGTTSVVGRYAYCIYNEGGLLDLNVAGYPSTPTNPQVPYKNAEGYADLTQIGLTQPQIDQIVKWRNAASLQEPDGYPGYVTINPTGYLRAGNTALFSGVSDQGFTSRRQMLDFFNNNLGGGLTLDNTLQYLTTYSRDLNQPSYVPDPNKPVIAAQTSGGNDGAGGDVSSLLTGTGDARINPWFLAVRVTAGFTRNDQTTAVVGEPLVKQRFALNRLAWLTYQGPSATRNLSGPVQNGPDGDIWQLENAYHISQAWLAQGTEANIEKYFGLKWGANPANSAVNCWTYIHGSPSNAINTLHNVAQLTGANAREADFVELLKAAVCAGSVAKAATLPTGSASMSLGYIHQYPIDASLDYAIMQIFANIIDQYDCDGYPTTIYFQNSGNQTQFVGVENLPYLNRIRTMVIKAAEPKAGPAAPGTTAFAYGGAENAGDCAPAEPNGAAGSPTSSTLQDTGVGLVMLYPEIWNPHDWNPSNTDQTLGVPRPSSFEVMAQNDPAPAQGISYETKAPGSPNSTSAIVASSPGYTTRGFSLTPAERYLTESNTRMTFSLPAGSAALPLFREPTLLFKANVPSGSSLAAPGLKSILGSQNLAQFVDANLALKSGVQDANGFANGDAELQDPQSQGYIGFYLGSFPLHWVGNNTTVTPNQPYNYGGRNANNCLTTTNNPLSPVAITYALRYTDPSGNLVTYDQKYCDLYTVANDDLTVSDSEGFFNPAAKNNTIYSAIDPRTSRFGFVPSCNFNDNQKSGLFPPFKPNGGDTVGWISRTLAMVCSQRMGKSAGMAFYFDPTSEINSTFSQWWMTSGVGFYPGSNTISGALYAWTGLFEQNQAGIVNDHAIYDGAPNSPLGASDGVDYYADPDGIVRRGSGAYEPSAATSAAATTGLEEATADTGTARLAQASSRPIILNRPFASVADLGYVFSGTPWKNLDFFTPESGDAPMLDVFCLNPSDNVNGLVAGKVDLNTRQVPVLQAILAGAYRDEWNSATTTLPASLAQAIAQGLVTRTTTTTGSDGPLRNPSELVGKWVNSVAGAQGGIDGSKSFDGFSADLSTLLSDANDLNTQRFRETAMRALANSGQTRVWNLMIDLVAQVGRYPKASTSLNDFQVDGEQRYWVHISIDRYTGQVLDKQIEAVRE